MLPLFVYIIEDDSDGLYNVPGSGDPPPPRPIDPENEEEPMKPTEILINEHRVIERVLDRIETMSEEAAVRRTLDKALFADVASFLRDYADRCHHGKEEHLLFPLLEKRGVSRKGGPLGGMRFDHIQARSLVGALKQAAASTNPGNGQGYFRFVSSARDYIRLLRNHIDEGDNILFPLADEILSEVDQEYLLEAFEKVENGLFGPEFHRKYTAMADSLSGK